MTDTPPAAALRVVFFGTPAFAVPVLEHLLLSRYHVCGVVTQPDRPRGRGQQPSAGPVTQLALAQALPLAQPERIRDPALLDALADWRPDVGVVAAYGRILPQALIDLPRLGMFNVHASLLPKYRGAAPIQRAVLAGELETGITIIRLVPELDAGPMLARLVVPLGPDQTSAAIEHELAFLGAALMVATLDDVVSGAAVEEPQDPRLVTYAPRLVKADGRVDWTASARQIHDRIRGLHPWPHAFTYLSSDRYILLRSRLVPGNPVAADGAARAGQVMAAAGDQLLVLCGDGALLSIVELQAEGRRAQTTREFLAGHAVHRGHIFGPGPGS